MIISHKHKYIFIKTQKVSGTSMEIALSYNVGRKDIITPLNLEDEILRFKKTNILPRFYSKDKKFEKIYSDYIKKLSLKKLSREILDNLEKKIENKKFKKNIFYNHINAKDIRKKIGKKIWNNYFKFTIERNPHDKVISFMFFANRFKKIKNLKEELNKTIKLKKYLNYQKYTYKNKVLVDFIINYHNLRSDLKFTEKRLKIPIRKFYVKTKNYTRKPGINYRKIFTKKQFEKISKDAKIEFKIMGFKKIYG